jgi:hypothetical protein
MGIRHVICRLVCPGLGTTRGNPDVQRFKLWLIGILCTNQMRDGPTNDWAQCKNIMEPWLKEDVVFKIKYSADNLRLTIYINPNGDRSRKFISKHYTLDKTSGGLFIAAELTSKSASVAQTLLSIWNSNSEEWAQFIKQTRVAAPFLARGFNDADAADILDQIEALEVMVDNAQVNQAHQNLMIDQYQVLCQHEHANDDKGANQYQIHMRMAMEGSCCIGQLLSRVPLSPRLPLPLLGCP